MNTSHDAFRHLEYLRQSLAQDKKPIGFFLSAGCPLAISMPKGQWPLIPDIRNLSLWVNSELNGEKTYTHLLQELTKSGQPTENIEVTLSFIRGLLQVSKGGEVRGLKESDLLKLDQCVCKKIVEKMNVDLPNKETPYHKLAKWISSIDRETPIEIFTTNYDRLTEQALEDQGVPYFDGFVGARRPFFDLRAVENNLIPKHWTRLWKIHGSINWCQDDREKDIYRATEVLPDKPHLIYPSHLKYEQSRKMPYLALVDQLGRFIRQKSSFLLILGYSFSDDDLNHTIINALKANPTSMALALMYDTFNFENDKKEITERYSKAYRLAESQHNLNLWAFNKAIIGTSSGAWKKGKETEDQGILRFFDEKEGTVKLGDFLVFADFLVSLIGSERGASREKESGDGK